MNTPHDAEWLEYDDDTRPVTKRPADTIREALTKVRGYRRDEFGLFPSSDAEIDAILAALTELEQQLAALKTEIDVDCKALKRAEAAEADREKMHERIMAMHRACDKAEADRDRLADTLRAIVNHLGPDHFGGELEGLVAEGNEALRLARAALARHTTP